LSLQRRLTLFFVVIVVVPLAAAGVIAQRIVGREIDDRTALALGPALDAAVIVYNERSDALDVRLRAAVGGRHFTRLLKERDRGPIDSYLSKALSRSHGVDFLGVVDNRGRALGFVRRPGHFAPGFDEPSPDQIGASSAVSPGFVKSEIPIRIATDRTAHHLVGGFWLDEELLTGFSGEDVDLSLVAGERVTASTLDFEEPRRVDVSFRGSFEAHLNGSAAAQAREIDNGVAYVASTPIEGGGASAPVWSSIAALLLLALLATSALAFLLARLITKPLEELAEGAQAIAESQFDHNIPVRSKDEVGRLAVAFNDMASKLQDTIDELSSSRDQLQRTITRVGETLRSTHDMSQLRESIVNTAADAVDAHAAVLWTLSASRRELVPAATRGVDLHTVGRIEVGSGIAGLVAERALTVMLPSGEGGPNRARGEPAFDAVIAAPLYAGEKVTGTLVTYRANEPFTQGDFETVVFLAEQAGVAIENVMLHEDARRLSLTDGLTGAWNRRYLQMQFRGVLATSTRFAREFSVLMLDLDRFKVINDTFGHQRGDAVLIEFAQRVTGTLREVDTFVRYGGEEFVCLLPETGVSGAATAAEKVLQAVRSEPFGTGEGDPVRLTVSIGTSTYPYDGESFRTLVDAADRALYRAKQEGRDRWRAAGEPKSGLRLA
jgi:two-component system, cell cycle response regulator